MMKGTKYFWLVAMLCLASCTPNGVLIDETPEPEEAPRKIGFETFVNKALRAAGTNSNELNDFYPTFNVYGWKFVGGVETCVFNNVPVEYFAADAAGSVVYTSGKPSNEWNAFSAGWYYQDIRYWDQMASNYQFSAYAPAAASANVTCSPNGVIEIGSDVSPITVEATNLMATPATELAYTGFNLDYMTATSTSATSPVSLTFKHLQAKFNVRIKLAASVTTAQDISVQKVEIHNLGDKAYYLSSAVAPAVDGWSLGTATPTYVPKVHTAYSLNNAVKNYHNHYVLEQLIIPQTIRKAASSAPSLSEFAEACVYVEYTIGAETFKNFTPLANIFDDTADTYDFKAGNQYTLNITIGPAPIYFEPQVATWADAIEKEHQQN